MARSLTSLALLVPALAAAQNADGVLLGMEAATTAGAVVAVPGDAATAYYNPACLASLEGPTVQVSGSAYTASVVHLGRFVATMLPWTRTDQSVGTTSLYSVPSVVAYGLRVRPGLGVAAGVWVPSHEEVAFTSNLRSEGAWTPGGSVTRASYEQHVSVSQKISRTYFGAAAGLAAAPRVRIGLSGFVTYDAAENFASIFAVATTDSQVPGEGGGTVSITSSGKPTQLALRFGGGVQWEVTQVLTLGLAVKSPSVVLARRGSITTTASATALFPGSPPTIAFFRKEGERLRLLEPWRIAGGGAVALGALSLRAEADWQAPTSAQRGVVNARLGALYGTGDIRGGAGVFTDRARDLASSGTLAVDYLGATAGLFYRPAPVRSARERGGAWDLWTSLAVRYAHGTGHAAGFGIAPLGGIQAPPSATVHIDTFTVTLGGLVQF
jgi:hypothetical protein